MKKDPRFIKAWLKLSERFIRTNKNEAKHHSQEKGMMEQYFKWHPPNKKSHKRRKLKTLHQKQDIHPD
jgi:hypothetical protein